MLVLDTDHITEYQKGTSPKAERLKRRLDESTESFATTIVTVEEIMRGWMASLRRIHDPRLQVNPYARLRQLDWDNDAADQFWLLKHAKIRTGTMDLKIASICLAHDATLLSSNRNDFAKVPRLRVEDWLN
jgi:tRNA(fMet)-specific endonuclease VapC